jgi:hypothetical protein
MFGQDSNWGWEFGFSLKLIFEAVPATSKKPLISKVVKSYVK